MYTYMCIQICTYKYMHIDTYIIPQMGSYYNNTNILLYNVLRLEHHPYQYTEVHSIVFPFSFIET